MNIGLIDIDTHNFPNFALMKISAYYKSLGYNVEWAQNGLFKKHYDKIYSSKIFTFSQDIDYSDYDADVIIKGGTGYDIRSKLEDNIEQSKLLDYSLYPQYPFSIQFLSRGCIRQCPFCLVREKEGYIKSVEPHKLNPNGKWIEVLDNNFFANPNWKDSVFWLNNTFLPINLHGIDVRIMNEEQAYYLNSMKISGSIHIAWDNPKDNIIPCINDMLKYIKPYKIICYVLIGYWSTLEQDLERVYKLRELGIRPFVQAYRDYDNKRALTLYEKDFMQYVNKRQIFTTCNFDQFKHRKGFCCDWYIKNSKIVNEQIKTLILKTQK